jgi:uncharacterized protein with HEPN domain
MKADKEFLRHILDEINFVLRETRGLAFRDFMKNETLTRACTRSLEIIGEAVKNLSPKFRKRYKEVEWKKLAGMRDKIIHFYFGVNWDIVWDVIKNHLPELKSHIEDMLKETAD